MTLKLYGLKEIPLVKKGDNIAKIIEDDLKKEDIALENGDILLIAETLISKAEGNYIKIDELEPSEETIKIAEQCKKDPKLVEAILQESNEIVAVGPNFIVTETKHGFVCANSGIDESNVEEGLATPMPKNPDQSAKEIREYLEEKTDKEIAVIITDTQGRAFRVGAIGTAIGCSGINPLWVRIGEEDLFGRALETTEVATADELAAAASLLMGQANEGIPIVLIRGFTAFDHLRDTETGIKPLLRPKEFKEQSKSDKMAEIKFKCTNCDFAFTDMNLIFYLNSKLEDLESILNSNSEDLELIEESLNKENSDKMTKALISGFLYENYCPHCNELISTYVPEANELFNQEEIEKILNKEISKNTSEFKILFFDFKKTLYRDRRKILENNKCPNCENEMSLVISEKTPCPKCGASLKEEF